METGSLLPHQGDIWPTSSLLRFSRQLRKRVAAPGLDPLHFRKRPMQRLVTDIYDSGGPLQPPNRQYQKSAKKVNSRGSGMTWYKSYMFLTSGVPNLPDPKC